MKTTRSYLQTKLSVLLGQGFTRSQVVRSIAVPHAFDCMMYVRSQLHVRLIVGIAFDRTMFDRISCDRSQKLRSIADNCLRIPTAQVLKQWSIGPTRATSETRVHMAALDRAPCARSYQVRSIALLGVKTSTFAQLHPFELQFAPRTYNTLKH